MEKITANKLLKKIRKHCLYCCCGSYEEVKLCPDTDCNLWKYRLGKIEEKRAGKIVDLIESTTMKHKALT